ncbi:MAG: peptide chain release factor 1 [Dethiobacteria bacterium]|jgi:peptide chain release factor 1|nr:peptide chain release factor 1 [Bacillota bacterium]NMD32848.1 peptide chain release factor 1 [Bacillota bacterium]HOB28627.1 peptide chain release factor 1 [Bacillota bacterium]HPZ41315.1 peptide chain release factor 1 [Bacillota bacterium]HQD52376.1 peptide chain release factor 1 [Bacillota bacterium]
MFEKMDLAEKRYDELARLLSDPEILARQELWQQYSRELAMLTPGVELYRRYRDLNRELADARELLQDDQDGELSEFLQEEIARITGQIEKVARELKEHLLPRDPHDQKNVFLEIRAGTGGEEAALFAADLLRMYSRYAERNGWKVEIVDAHATDIGGFKEVVVGIEGKGVYSRLKYESGVHRVQRIPATESGGRIHTSAATVAVLPEAEELEVEINPQELRIDTYCSTGPGGQSVNTTQSAVRITHLPTGLVVTCQDEKSQLKNREKALRVLRSRLLDKYTTEQAAELAEARRSQIGSGDRSERIRTYNFPQNRVTDHRIGLTLHQLDLVLDGELDQIIDQLIASEKAKQLQSTGE